MAGIVIWAYAMARIIIDAEVDVKLVEVEVKARSQSRSNSRISLQEFRRLWSVLEVSNPSMLTSVGKTRHYRHLITWWRHSLEMIGRYHF